MVKLANIYECRSHILRSLFLPHLARELNAHNAAADDQHAARRRQPFMLSLQQRKDVYDVSMSAVPLVTVCMDPSP